MRWLSVPVILSTMLSLGGCGDGSLSTGVEGAGGGLSSGGAVGTGGVSSAGTGGAGAELAFGGVVGTGGADVALSTGGVVGTDGASSAGETGVDGPLSSGGVVGTDGALSTGGIVGAVDAREGGTVADGAGEAAAGSGKNILDLVPLDNTVSGWIVDQASNRAPGQRAMIATTEQEVEALIDGAAADFFMAPYTPKVFAWQNYVNRTLPAAPDGARLRLFILQMPSVEQAAGLYKALLQTSLYSRKVGSPDDWQDPTTPSMGTDSRIQDTGSEWWINFRRDVFYVEVSLDPSYGPPPDYIPSYAVTKQEALRFAQAVASRI
jgi:hypothetical protein